MADIPSQPATADVRELLHLPEPRPDEPQTKRLLLHVGIDLGTYRTTIASSQGMREHMASIVGWPRNAVARKLVQHGILYGNTAFRNRLALDIVRPFKGGAFGGTDDSSKRKHREAARELLQHAVDLARPAGGEIACSVIAVPTRASVDNREELEEIARRTVGAAVLVPEPFAVAYGLGMLANTVVVDVGAESVDLCRLRGAMPAADDLAFLDVSGDWLDRRILAALEKKFPDSQASVSFARDLKERFGAVPPGSPAAIAEIPTSRGPQTADLTDLMRKACSAVAPPILKALQKLLEPLGEEAARRFQSNIVLAGGGGQLKGLSEALEEGLREMGGGRVIRLEEPVYAGAAGALKLAKEVPEEVWGELKRVAKAGG